MKLLITGEIERHEKLAKSFRRKGRITAADDAQNMADWLKRFEKDLNEKLRGIHKELKVSENMERDESASAGDAADRTADAYAAAANALEILLGRPSE